MFDKCVYWHVHTQNNTDLIVDAISAVKGIPVVYGNYMAAHLSNTFCSKLLLYVNLLQIKHAHN